MPLPDGYGVLVGDYQSYGTEQGQWYHVDLNISAAGSQYQGAVDVNEQTQVFQYLVLDGLDQSLFTVAGLADGWHLLASNSTSGAMDYARSPILQKPLGCLGVIFGLWNAATGGNVPTFTDVTGNEAGEALIAMWWGQKNCSCSAPRIRPGWAFTTSTVTRATRPTPAPRQASSRN